jgi:putative phosphoesterase
MRVAALGDIHGNLPALEAVLAEIGREDVDAIVVPGDTISGPWPVEVFDLLEEAGARHVRGNADDEVVRRSDRYGQLAIWSADRLGEDRVAVAAGWPLTLELDVDGLGRVLVCHSTPSSNEPIYTRITPGGEVVALLGPLDADVVVCGHTHIQFDRRLESGPRLVNAGSVGMPYEARPAAYWALIGPDVELRRTEYDVEAAVAAIREVGAPVDERQLELLLDPPDPDTATAEFERMRGAA